MSYLAAAMNGISTPGSAVLQTQPIPGRELDMVENSAGGYTFKASDQAKLERFLVLGTEKGTFYASEQKLTLQAASHVAGMVKNGQALKVVETVLDFSLKGRTPKQDTLIFCLAMVIKLAPEAEERSAAYRAVTQVCRIPTSLFQLFEFEKVLSPNQKATWGAGMRKAISEWYLAKDAMQLAFITSKYKSRNDWTHRDVLRVAHVKLPGAPSKNAGSSPEPEEAAPVVEEAAKVRAPPKPLPPITTAKELVLRYIVRGYDGVKTELESFLANGAADQAMDIAVFPAEEEDDGFEVVAHPASEGAPAVAPKASDPAVELHKVASFIAALEKLTDLGKKQGEPTPADISAASALIRKFWLAREHVSTSFLNSPDIWRALLDIGMPLHALTRNLGKMTSIELLKPLSDESDIVCKALGDRGKIRKSRLHPFSVLLAMETYRAGRGVRGSLSWEPDQRIVDTLGDAFDLAFENVEPTGKRYFLGIDVSGSMCSPIAGSPISSRTAAAAVALTLVRSEERVYSMAFCDTFVPFPIGKKESLESVVSRMDNMPFGSTDCSLPMQYALQRKIMVDVFIVLTDNETYFGSIHPSQALEKYRREVNPGAKLCVCAFAVNDFTIADPEDLGMMDCVGLDASLPAVIRDFALRELA